MTKDEIKWLEDPKAELRRQPDGTLIVILQRDGKLQLGYLSENKPEDFTQRIRRYPDEKFTTVESMLARGAKISLL